MIAFRDQLANDLQNDRGSENRRQKAEDGRRKAGFAGYGGRGLLETPKDGWLTSV